MVSSLSARTNQVAPRRFVMNLSRLDTETRLSPSTVRDMVDDVARKDRFAYALVQAMEARQLSADDLARSIGRERRTIQRWRSGDSVPSVLELGPLARALGVDPNLFIEPPPIPEYPIHGYLLPQAEAEGVAEGSRRAARRAQEGQ